MVYWSVGRILFIRQFLLPSVRSAEYVVCLGVTTLVPRRPMCGPLDGIYAESTRQHTGGPFATNGSFLHPSVVDSRIMMNEDYGVMKP